MSQKKPITEKGLILYKDYEFIFNFLTKEEIGEVVLTLLNTMDNPTLNPSENNNVNNAYNYIANRIIDYKEKKCKAVKNGKKGGNPLFKRDTTLNPTLNGGDKLKEKKIKEKKIKEDNNIEKINKKENLDFIPDDFKLSYQEWLNYRMEIKKPLKEASIKANYNQLMKLANNNFDVAKEIINQSISNGYQGLFELKKKVSYSQKGNQSGYDCQYGSDIPL